MIFAHGETTTAKEEKITIRQAEGKHATSKGKSFHIKVPHMMRSPTAQAIRGRDA